MKTSSARYGAAYALSLLGSALAACPDNNLAESTTDSGTGSTATTAAGATDGSSTGDGPTTGGPGPTTSTAGDATATGESTGGGLCTTLLCGDPAACCADGAECVDGACVELCPGGVRCGAAQEQCCADGDVCAGPSCATPGGPCDGAEDCEPGDYCEPVLGKCLKQPDPLLCEVVPKFVGDEVELEWAFTKDQVTSMPVVADVTGDATPEVIVNTTRVTGVEVDWPLGELVCLDGKTGAELWRIEHDPANKQFGAHGRATIAVGDVSGDGKPDIVYAGLPEGTSKVSPIYAVDGEGALLWTSHLADDSIARIRIDNGTATLANLDDDPQAEIAFGAAILDHDGLLVWNQGDDGGMVGSPHNKGQPATLLYRGGMATFADLDKDGKPELVTGREAWTIDWKAGDPPTVSLAQKWKDTSGFGGDGWPSIGDLDGNGTPEVVLTAWPELKILDGATGKLWCGVDPTGVMCEGDEGMRTQPIAIPGGNLGGPATIADFDGDGRAEIGITTGNDYRVFDLNRPGEVIAKPRFDPDPAAGAIFTRWQSPVQDKSSASTGSSVFDFQGDGAAEVAYQDECFARIYDGSSGQVLLAIMNSSATIHEYPLVVDVDGDGDSELLMVANHSDPQPRANCLAATPGWAVRQGVYAYGAGAVGNWVPTREVWTQHTYHVTNATSEGNVPMMEQDNWTTPGLNNFRQNVQGAAAVNAADVSVSLAVVLDKCDEGELVLQATVYNEGALGLPAGVVVSFHEGTDDTGLKLASEPTIEAIVTGGSTTVRWTVDAPPAGMTRSYFAAVDGGGGNGVIQECNEGNNEALVTDASCQFPG